MLIEVLKAGKRKWVQVAHTPTFTFCSPHAENLLAPRKIHHRTSASRRFHSAGIRLQFSTLLAGAAKEEHRDVQLMLFRSANTYTNTMTSVIRNVYRKLEEFLIKEGKKSIEAISADDFQVIRSPLIQAREWLYEPELETFFKFVKFTYNLNGDKELSVERAVRLYGQIMLTL
jgi:hypothetical protein